MMSFSSLSGPGPRRGKGESTPGIELVGGPMEGILSVITRVRHPRRSRASKGSISVQAAIRARGTFSKLDRGTQTFASSGFGVWDILDRRRSLRRVEAIAGEAKGNRNVVFVARGRIPPGGASSKRARRRGFPRDCCDLSVTFMLRANKNQIGERLWRRVKELAALGAFWRSLFKSSMQTTLQGGKISIGILKRLRV